jgi:hypothetical protein
MECAFAQGQINGLGANGYVGAYLHRKCMNLVGIGWSCRVDTSRDAAQSSWYEFKGIPQTDRERA